MNRMIYQNENAVLNHLGVRKLTIIECQAKIKIAGHYTPAELKEFVADLKSDGATNIKIK